MITLNQIVFINNEKQKARKVQSDLILVSARERYPVLEVHFAIGPISLRVMNLTGRLFEKIPYVRK